MIGLFVSACFDPAQSAGINEALAAAGWQILQSQ
jgi:hypothetical protein